MKDKKFGEKSMLLDGEMTFSVSSKTEETDRDIIKTHLLYLERLDCMTDSERGYFYREYFPYLKSVYNAPLVGTLDTFSGYRSPENEVQEPEKSVETDDPVVEVKRMPGSITDEFKCQSGSARAGVTLRSQPNTILKVAFAKSYTEYVASNKHWTLTYGRDYAINYTTGIISIHNNGLDMPKILTVLGVQGQYSIFVEYVPKDVPPATQLDKGPNEYVVGADGE